MLSTLHYTGDRYEVIGNSSEYSHQFSNEHTQIHVATHTPQNVLVVTRASQNVYLSSWGCNVVSGVTNWWQRFDAVP